MTSFDISDTLAPTSDQLDAVDLLSGPRTFVIERVTKGTDEQPVNLWLADFPRPWRPGKSMRRVLVSAWGADASAYVGRKVRLFCDPEVRFGGAAVGGTRIAALSHIDKPKQVPLLVSRGKSAIFVVTPLADEPARPAQEPAQATTEPAAVPTAAELIAAAEKATSGDELSRIARTAVAVLSPADLDEVKAAVTVRRAELAEMSEDGE